MRNVPKQEWKSLINFLAVVYDGMQDEHLRSIE